MGDIADDVASGYQCSHCGTMFEREHGYPVLCTSCHADDGGATGLPLAIEFELEGDGPASGSATDAKRAKDMAAHAGLELRYCSPDGPHYQLRKHAPTATRPGNVEWILNLYPGKSRIYSDPNKPGPFLRVKAPWTLCDVVRAAVQLMGGEHG